MRNLVCASLCLVLVTLPATRVVNHRATRMAYNSEEHKLLADRGASMVNQRSAVLPGLTTFLTLTPTQMVAGYKYAKQLSVGYESNVNSDYDPFKRGPQDHSYWTDRSFDQLQWNRKIWIPSTSEVRGRTLYVTIWDGHAEARFSFGELVALYGDYRKTVSCSRNPDRCYLTNRDAPQYRVGFSRPAGTIDFAYGDNCFDVVNCGWRPDTVGTFRYLRAIGSGLLPPFGAFGNQFVNTAYSDEELDAGWWGDEMLRIANINDWHFSQAAVAWYIGMHRLALKYVFMARTDPGYWNHALSFEAAALHSLTDLFAFGHIVTSRDQTSYAIMGINSLRNDPIYEWMEDASQMGGGVRSPSTGRVELTATLPPIDVLPTITRNDFMESDRGSWALVAKREHDHHDAYNNAGATVMNLKRQEFTIFGDGKLRETADATENIIVETVRVSLQSLFDAYESPSTLEQLGAVGSSFFDALLNIPVYVKTHPQGNFEGRWTRYAAATSAITGAGMVPENPQCVMAYVDGENPPPANPAQPTACTTPAPLTESAVVSQLLNRNGTLGRGDQAGLDDAGNRDGSYDVGDFLAWVRANPSAAVLRGSRPNGRVKGSRP
jgi:hypothetical protein